MIRRPVGPFPRTLLAALLLLGAAPPLLAQTSRGSLVIVGGGPMGDAINRRFVDLAGGAASNIVVLPMASEDGDDAGRLRVAVLEKLGAKAIFLNLTHLSASSDSVARLLGSATGIWFNGGLQTRLADVLLGTRALDSIRARFKAGAVVGGTSAGAAVMSDPMITGDEKRPGGVRPVEDTSSQEWMTIDADNVVMAPGFGLLPEAIVDQHFLRRRRHNRLVSLVLERAPHLAIGIDESTALVVNPAGEWEIVGESQAVVYDARQAHLTPAGATMGATNVIMHVLPAGSRWNPRSGAPVLPAR